VSGQRCFIPLVVNIHWLVGNELVGSGYQGDNNYEAQEHGPLTSVVIGHSTKNGAGQHCGEG